MGERQSRDVWEQLGWVWTALFYGLLILITAVILTGEELTERERLLVVGLTLSLALWFALLLWVGQQRLWQNWKLGLPLVLAGVLLWYPLAFIHDIFYFLLAGLFPTIYSNLKIQAAIFMSVVVAALATFEQSGGSVTLDSPILWIYASGVGTAIFLGLWMHAIIGQSVRRRILIEQLEATRSELAAAERREGVLQERDRLAREIHDTLSQGFTSIVMHLEAAEQAMPDDLATVSRHMDTARQTARDSLRQAREVVQDLRPELLARQSLPQAIERVGLRWSEESGIDLTTRITGEVVDLAADVDVTILRVVQEALANVRKHAQATAVTVTLSYMGDRVVLDVQDNGVGLQGAEPSRFAGGFGLTAMRERLEGLGGTMVVESERDEGTTLMIEIPQNGGA